MDRRLRPLPPPAQAAAQMLQQIGELGAPSVRTRVCYAPLGEEMRGRRKFPYPHLSSRTILLVSLLNLLELQVQASVISSQVASPPRRPMLKSSLHKPCKQPAAVQGRGKEEKFVAYLQKCHIFSFSESPAQGRLLIASLGPPM